MFIIFIALFVSSPSPMSEVRLIRTVLAPEFALRQPARLRTACMILPPAPVVSDLSGSWVWSRPVDIALQIFLIRRIWSRRCPPALAIELRRPRVQDNPSVQFLIRYR